MMLAEATHATSAIAGVVGRAIKLSEACGECNIVSVGEDQHEIDGFRGSCKPLLISREKVPTRRLKRDPGALAA